MGKKWMKQVYYLEERLPKKPTIAFFSGEWANRTSSIPVTSIKTAVRQTHGPERSRRAEKTRSSHYRFDIGFLKTNEIKLRSGATSIFDVQRWTFDVRRSSFKITGAYGGWPGVDNQAKNPILYISEFPFWGHGWTRISRMLEATKNQISVEICENLCPNLTWNPSLILKRHFWFNWIIYDCGSGFQPR